jgi:hypothetical protein
MNPGRGAAGVVLTLAISAAASAAEPEQAPEAPSSAPARLALALWRPMSIASQRLSDPRCTAIFHDYRDHAGAPLAAALDGRGRTAVEHFRSITYVATLSGPCRLPAIVAWTTIGSSRVAICTPRFEALSRRNPRLAAAVLIHEMLHTLGLPEGPPSPESITSSVAERCGR